jgi:ATP-dependent DNA helicase RecG
MVRLVLKGSNRTFDSLRTDCRTDDYSFALLASTFRERTQQEWDKKYLQSFGLVTKDGYLTNAGMLFTDYCEFSQSRLYCTRWAGLEKDDALNDAEYKGNILLLLLEAMNFVKSSTRKGWEKLPDGRKNKPEYAERAVLEALVNHFIHRDYTVMGGEVHLDIYDDRLVITSPGGMYNGQKVQDLDIEEVSSDRRNPILADVMAQLDYMEKRGSGLKRICNETRSLESYKEDRKPKFKSSSSHFITTIYSMEYDPEVTKQSSSSNQVEGTSRGQVRGHVLRLIKVLNKEDLPVRVLMEKLELNSRDKFLKNYLTPVLEAGLVEMTQPDSPNSPTQRYVLTEEGRKLLE